MVVILKKYGLLLKPQNILLFSRSFLPWGSAATLVCFMIGTLWGLALTPADYQQGNLVKIMYVHVPASWGALAIYTLMAICSAAGLILRMPLYFYATQSLAPIGASFCFLSLVTGSLWGKPTWGAWWVWDARLTSMLILFFLYLGYLNLVHILDQNKDWTTPSLMVVLGWINIPIIKWSVDWWYTLHQPASLLRLAKPAIHGQYLGPLFIMVAGFVFYTFTVGLWRLCLMIYQRRKGGEGF